MTKIRSIKIKELNECLLKMYFRSRKLFPWKYFRQGTKIVLINGYVGIYVPRDSFVLDVRKIWKGNVLAEVKQSIVDELRESQRMAKPATLYNCDERVWELKIESTGEIVRIDSYKIHEFFKVDHCLFEAVGGRHPVFIYDGDGKTLVGLIMPIC